MGKLKPKPLSTSESKKCSPASADVNTQRKGAQRCRRHVRVGVIKTLKNRKLEGLYRCVRAFVRARARACVCLCARVCVAVCTQTFMLTPPHTNNNKETSSNRLTAMHTVPVGSACTATADTP
jgi:hypothetical protein